MLVSIDSALLYSVDDKDLWNWIEILNITREIIVLFSDIYLTLSVFPSNYTQDDS